ncbi:hypothetical protein COCSADRAFT_228914 [Bipolaris sorokiniana ND90Pr]|uniref:Uncharacterized protein n=1 Tax=Cochliobolus sativus (strain ND90Pr / ATCC 201652) TaxID=665912 RepID=M2R4U3_COCSN|nr:uncharacterized protein COCSADRAFT_228914 [Bipolaris sorokiniana ND90Pr]EMD62174.1 hypothetical protein COCSADRAFT_228914 [Bipolaris sorokiniana ND90Pr]
MGYGVQHRYRNGFPTWEPGNRVCDGYAQALDDWGGGVFCCITQFDAAPGGLYTTFFVSFFFTFFPHLPASRDLRSDTPFFHLT